PPQGTDPLGTGAAGPTHTGPAGWLTGKAAGPHGVTGNETLARTGELARDNLLETIAILLLGLGGLILPYLFWPAGAIVALFSRLWDGKDKSVAVAGPLLVALAASVLGALIIGGSGNVIVVYFHALGVGFGVVIRVGAVLTAAYLAWRVTKGPRVKVPPWQRVKRPRRGAASGRVMARPSPRPAGGPGSFAASAARCRGDQGPHGPRG